MVKENYSYAFPLDQSNCLEVTLKVIDKLAVPAEDTSHLNAPSPEVANVLSEIESPDLGKIPDKIILAIQKAQEAFALQASRQHSFMVATPTGFQLLRLNQVVYFDYQPDKKQWVIWLANKTQLPLKRTTLADNILNYSPDFIRINQRQIINLDYLKKIDGRSCQLSFHPASEDRMIISRSYLKGLQERVEVI